MRSIFIIAIAAAGLLAGCSSSPAAAPKSASTPVGGATPSASAPTTTADASACSGGLTRPQEGVVSITCNGSAELKVSVNGSTTDLHGGVCQSGGGVWSATAGVLLDETGLNGTYSGPPVSDITVNNTADGKATIQVEIAGKHYFNLGTAKLQLSADKQTAHIEGAGDHLSDAPGAKIVIDVTC
jgi:hypothetical protein